MGVDVARLIALLAEAGLDLVHAFDAHAVGELARADVMSEEEDARTPVEPTFAKNRDGSTRMILPKTSRPLARWTRLAAGGRLGLLVGNTRALWAPFVAARGLPDANRLDTYVERQVERAIQACVDPEARHAVVYSHLRYDAAFLPFQQLAVTTGFAAQSDAGLAIHPVYGPWFALRAVITIDPPSALAILSSGATPITKPCVCSDTCETALAIARADLRDWRAWLAVRDACSLREYRYSDEQIRFHYASAWPKAAHDG